MKPDTRICPKFTESELSKIDLLVSRGEGRNRTDLVRMATVLFIEKKIENGM